MGAGTHWRGANAIIAMPTRDTAAPIRSQRSGDCFSTSQPQTIAQATPAYTDRPPPQKLWRPHHDPASLHDRRQVALACWGAGTNNYWYASVVKSPILKKWSSLSKSDGEAIVFPDGCRDVIFLREPGGGWRSFVSSLDESARRITLKTGCVHIGWRLRPGVSVRAGVLSRALHGCSAQEVDEARIAECCEVSVHLDEIMESLAAGRDTRSAAVLAGTSLRTFQRTTTLLTGKGPGFWIRLGRVRRAAVLARRGRALVEIAAHVGFSDQAHMTREFRHWFGMTPGRIRECDSLSEGVDASGFCTTVL